MRLSRYFFKTIKEIPTDAELKSHKLLIRGGYVKQVSAGIFSYFPLALRILKKIETIIRQEMDAINGQEVNMPVVMPAGLWSESGRYESVGDELLRFEDRVGRKMLLGMTHEEAVTDLARYVINSYKQLPVMLYQLQTKFRDEPRVRGGLIRVREFIMKDGYSFHTSQEDLEKYYQEVYRAYEKIFKRCGLPAIAVSSDVGMMGGSGADEFMAVTESGEDTLILCTSCDYKANREVAAAKRNYIKEEMLPMEEVATPGYRTIEEVSTFLNIPPEKTLKSVVYKAVDNEKEVFILAVIRGDLDINETKLKNYVKTRHLVLADDEELKKLGVIKGYAAPLGFTNLKIVADLSAVHSSNLVGGANKIDYHIKHVNFGRDYKTDDITDISSVKEGETCPCCGGKLHVTRGIEIGNIFKLGTKYSASMGAKYITKDGKEEYAIMGCYGIGVGRLMASILEVLAEDDKILWPVSVAPFEVELLGLHKDKDEDIIKVCEEVYKNLTAGGIDVLYDDRNASPGFKFKDADLVGCPIKVAIGKKSLESGGAEVTIGNNETIIVPLETLKDTIKQGLTGLFQAL